MTAPGRLLFIRHAPREFAYNLEPELEAEGYAIETVHFAAGQRPLEPDTYRAAIVFGGHMGACEEHAHPWILDELKVMESLMARNIPLLGICLGGQLLARLMGARVFRTPVPEFGYLDITLTPAGQASPLFRGVPSPFQGLLWHQDAFELPKGCLHLASSDHCAIQAFQAAPGAYGLQFHAEFTGDHLRHMIEKDRNDLPARSPAWQAPEAVAGNESAHASVQQVMMTLFRNLIHESASSGEAHRP